ncbi:hypothetical protein GQ600_24310 [Phytophthora cactorum]|nr:hypothetical protein GQ600_24310 [Phytophthora cactorum]
MASEVGIEALQHGIMASEGSNAAALKLAAKASSPQGQWPSHTFCVLESTRLTPSTDFKQMGDGVCVERKASAAFSLRNSKGFFSGRTLTSKNRN